MPLEVFIAPSPPRAVTAQPAVPEITLGSKVHVDIRREPFMEYFTLTLDNGFTEELDVEETKQWFRDHGANMDVVEKALDHCWNFWHSEVNINQWREPKRVKLAHEPQL